jgi:hypothetical protein
MIKYPWIKGLLLFFVLTEILWSQPQKPTPTAIFRAVFWDRFMSSDLIFSPWGNENDSNATLFTIRVGFSSPSRSFAYYGQSPLKLFTPIPTQTTEENNSSTPQLNQVAEFSFKPEQGRIQRYLLILLKQQQGSGFKVFPLSMSQNDLPFGSFVCYSQVKEALYLAYGDQKNVLSPGKSVKFSYVETDDLDKSKLKIFTRRNAKYEEAAVDFLRLNREKRAVSFLSSFRSRIRIKRYILNRESIESSLGYGASPFVKAMDESSDANSTNVDINIFK